MKLLLVEFLNALEILKINKSILKKFGNPLKAKGGPYKIEASVFASESFKLEPEIKERFSEQIFITHELYSQLFCLERLLGSSR